MHTTEPNLVARGIILRSLLVLAMLERGDTMTIPELAAAVERAGFGFAGRPSKVIADALRWETARSRVPRAGRGRYRAGFVAKVTRHRMQRPVVEARNRRHWTTWVA